jgi:hypothetical protein
MSFLYFYFLPCLSILYDAPFPELKSIGRMYHVRIIMASKDKATTRSRFLTEKLITSAIQKLSPFMKPEVSLKCSNSLSLVPVECIFQNRNFKSRSRPGEFTRLSKSQILASLDLGLIPLFLLQGNAMCWTLALYWRRILCFHQMAAQFV